MAANASVFDDARVWYRGAEKADTADRKCRALSSITESAANKYEVSGPTPVWHWSGPHFLAETGDVYCPYAGTTLNDEPFAYRPIPVRTNGTTSVTVDGNTSTQPIMQHCKGIDYLWSGDWVSNHADGTYVSNYTFVARIRADQPLNNKDGSGPGGGGTVLIQDRYLGVDKGLSLVLTGDHSLSNERKLRLFVGNSFKTLDAAAIPHGEWADVAIAVDGQNVTFAACSSRGCDWAELAFSGNTNLAIKAMSGTKGNFFMFGQQAWGEWLGVWTNGLATASQTYESGTEAATYSNVSIGDGGDNRPDEGMRTKMFRGAVHQIAFWDRTLSSNEICRAWTPGEARVFTDSRVWWKCSGTSDDQEPVTAEKPLGSAGANAKCRVFANVDTGEVSAKAYPLDTASWASIGPHFIHDTADVVCPYAGTTLTGRRYAYRPVPVKTNATDSTKRSLYWGSDYLWSGDWLAGRPDGYVTTNYTVVMRFRYDGVLNEYYAVENSATLFESSNYNYSNYTGFRLMLYPRMGLNTGKCALRLTSCAGAGQSSSDTSAFRYFLLDDNDANPSKAIPSGAWVDIALTVDKGLVKVYVYAKNGNGYSATESNFLTTEGKSAKADWSIRNGTSQFVLFGRKGSAGANTGTWTNGEKGSDVNPTQMFRGAVQQIAFWDRTLTEDEIHKAWNPDETEIFNDALVHYNGSQTAKDDDQDADTSTYPVGSKGKNVKCNAFASSTDDVQDTSDAQWWWHGNHFELDDAPVVCPYSNTTITNVMYACRPVPVVTNGFDGSSRAILSHARDIDYLWSGECFPGSGGASMEENLSEYAIVARVRCDEPLNKANDPAAYDLTSILLISRNRREQEANPGNGVCIGFTNAVDGLVPMLVEKANKHALPLAKIPYGHWADIALSVSNSHVTFAACANGIAGTNALAWSEFDVASGACNVQTYGGVWKGQFLLFGPQIFGGWNGAWTNGVETAESYSKNGVAGKGDSNPAASGENGDACRRTKLFRGAVHQLAFWDRALSPAEIRESWGMGRPSLVQVGLEATDSAIAVGDASIVGEFTCEENTVSGEGAWQKLDNVLNVGNKTLTINFNCPENWAGLPQYLRMRLSSYNYSGDGGTAAIWMNGEKLGEATLSCTSTTAPITSFYVPAGKIAAGPNSLTIERVEDGSGNWRLVFDFIQLGGSWQHGAMSGTDASFWKYDTLNPLGWTWELLAFYPAGGNDCLHQSGFGGSSRTREFYFDIPEMNSVLRGATLKLNMRQSGDSIPSFNVTVNGMALGKTYSMKTAGSGSDEVKIPSWMLRKGQNKVVVECTSTSPGVWSHLNGAQFSLLPPLSGGIFILFNS